MKREFEKNKQPLISVILPIHNVEKYLDACLDSLINQKYINLEIICINDGSTDNSSTILTKHQLKDDRIRVFYKENGGPGPGSARNMGLDLAKGDYISFIDPDDWCSPDFYSKMQNVIDQTGVDFVIGGSILFDDITKEFYPHEGSINLGALDQIHEKKKIGKEYLYSKCLALGSYVWNKLYNRKFLIDNKLRFKERVIYEDKFFSADVYYLANTFSFMTDKVYYYRVNRKDQITSTFKQVNIHIEYVYYLYSWLCRLEIFSKYEVEFWEYVFKECGYICHHCPDDIKEKFYSEIRGFLMSTPISSFALERSRFLQDESRIYKMFPTYYEAKQYWGKNKVQINKLIKLSIKDKQIKYYCFGICFLVIKKNKRYLFKFLKLPDCIFRKNSVGE